MGGCELEQSLAEKESVEPVKSDCFVLLLRPTETLLQDHAHFSLVN